MNFNPERLMVVFVIALIILGPKRLPDAARTAGRWLGELRKYTMSIRNEMRDLLGEDLRQGAAMRDELRGILAEHEAVLAEHQKTLQADAAEVRGWAEDPALSWTEDPSVPSLPQGKAAPIAVPDDPNLN